MREIQDRRIIHSAEIICVGTELLMGHTLNTNSAYLSAQLANIGIPSYRQTVVGDNKERLLSLIRESASRTDLIIFTGGLGPTSDDLTMEVAAEAAALPLVYDEASYAVIEEYFRSAGRQMCDHCDKQAYLPAGSIILPNTNGTAPGAIFDCPAPNPLDPQHICTLILLPGPPSEVVPMFALSVRNYLEAAAPFRFKSAFVRLIGIGEAQAEETIRDLIDAQSNPTIAPYASEGECMFRVTQKMDTDQDPDLLTPVLEIFRARFGHLIYEIGDRSLQQVVYDLLKQAGKTIAFAESCTAGMISSSFGNIPGASSVFMGSVVSYDNRIKTGILGVRQETLATHGAVSAQCAEEMAVGVRDRMQTDISVSVTGIAGPDGGTKEKPVGLVYIALNDSLGTVTEECHFHGNRMRIRKNACTHALDMIRKRLLNG